MSISYSFTVYLDYFHILIRIGFSRNELLIYQLANLEYTNEDYVHSTTSAHHHEPSYHGDDGEKDEWSSGLV